MCISAGCWLHHLGQPLFDPVPRHQALQGAQPALISPITAPSLPTPCPLLHLSRTSDGLTSQINGTPAMDVIKDEAWYKEVMIPCVQKRGAAIIAARKLSSALSAAQAISDHMNNWFLGTPAGTFVSMAVDSTGNKCAPSPSPLSSSRHPLHILHHPTAFHIVVWFLFVTLLSPSFRYGVAEGLMYSFPVTCANGEWTIVEGLTVRLPPLPYSSSFCPAPPRPKDSRHSSCFVWGRDMPFIRIAVGSILEDASRVAFIRAPNRLPSSVHSLMRAASQSDSRAQVRTVGCFDC